MSKSLIGAAVTAAAAIALGLAAPATAASLTKTDPADADHGVDLRSVRVVNAESALTIVLSHADLRRIPRSGAGGAVYLDTDPADSGPELVFVGGYFEGTDYQLLHTDGFGVRKWRAAVASSYQLTLEYDKDKTRMRISRQALRDVGDVRVAVRVAGDRPDGSKVVDWLGEPRSFTPWVARG